MTPQEKAEELFQKFDLDTGLMSTERKQCAIIAVDEILKLEQARLIVGNHNYYDYYIEVKTELQKL
jgi:hypothetical protein